MPKQFSSAHWRARGEQTRTLAEATIEGKFRHLLLDMANEYDKLAEFTAKRRSTNQRLHSVTLPTDRIDAAILY